MRSACLDASARAIDWLQAAFASRAVRRSAAACNLAVFGIVAAGALPEVAGLPVSFSAAAATGASPLLLLATTSAIASVLLLAGAREGLRPTVPKLAAPELPGRAADACGAMPESAEAETEIVVAELMARMGHDLRTPLNAIIGFSDIMQRELLGPLGSDRYQIYAEHIRTSGLSLLQAIEQTLEVTGRLAEGGARERGATVPQHRSS